MEKQISEENKSIVEQGAMHCKTWQSIKSKYSNAIVLLRIEDYYFAFDNDAFILSSISGISAIECEELKLQCCFPFSQLDIYLHKLVKAGYRVAVCDQLVSTP